MTQSSPQTQTDPLAALQDIHSPLEPSFWPPSWEFWCALLALVFVLLWCVYLYKKTKAPIWYTEAQTMLTEAIQQFEQQLDAPSLLNINTVLKRIALSLNARDSVAHLQGQAWCHWLDQQGQCNHFTQGIGQCLGDQAYDPDFAFTPESVPLLENTLMDWLKTQKKRSSNEQPHHDGFRRRLQKCQRLSIFAKFHNPMIKKPSTIQKPVSKDCESGPNQ